MFIINLTYKTDIENVDHYLNEHVEFLNEQYQLKNFIASGRKIPRTGGIILSTVKDKVSLEQIINKDPFKKFDIADYSLIEFIPSKTSAELEFLNES